MKKLLMLLPVILLCGVARADMFSVGEPVLVVMAGTTINGYAVAGSGNSLVGWTMLTGSNQFYKIGAIYEESGRFDVLYTSAAAPYGVVSNYSVAFAGAKDYFRFTPPTTAGTYTGIQVSLTFTTKYEGSTPLRIKFEAYK